MKKIALLIMLFIGYNFSYFSYMADDLDLEDIFNLISDGQNQGGGDMPTLTNSGAQVGDINVTKDSVSNGDGQISNGNITLGDDMQITPDSVRNGDLTTNEGASYDVNNNFGGDTYNMNNNADNNYHMAGDEIDNVVYNPFGYVKGDYVYVYYIPGKGVPNVRIFYSYDNSNYIPIITLSADKKSYHFPVDFSKKEIYIKILPIDPNGVYGIMKQGTRQIPYIVVPLTAKKIADKKVGHAKTGPELGILFILALFAYGFYRYRKI